MIPLRKADVIKGFQDVIEIQGWEGDRSSYAVILGNLAARAMNDDARARKFLTDSAGKLKSEWPEPAVRFLRGDMDHAELLKLSTDNDKLTESHYFIGMDDLLRGNVAKAKIHFGWVQDNGNPTFTEYFLAIAELDRLAR